MLSIEDWWKSNNFDKRKHNDEGFTAIHEAAKQGHVEVVEYCLQEGFDLREVSNSDGFWTPLMLAAKFGQVNIIDYLISRGVVLNEENRIGSTACMAAASGGQLEIVNRIVAEFGLKELFRRNKRQSTIALWAAQSGSIPVMEYLLSNGCSLVQRNENGDEPIGLAAFNGHLELLKWLALKGCSLDTIDNSGETLTMAASLRGHIDIIKWLVANGANLELRTNGGLSVLTYAITHQPSGLSILRYLVETAPSLASFARQPNHASTMIIEASKYNHIEGIRWMIEELGVKVPPGLDLALRAAAAHGHIDMMRFLTTLLNQDSKTPEMFRHALIAAGQYGFLKVLRYIFENFDFEWDNSSLYRCARKAAKHGKLDVLRWLVKERRLQIADHPEVLRNTVERRPLLKSVAMAGHMDVLKYLIEEQHADPHFSHFRHSTALIGAATTGKLDIVKYLCEEHNCELDPIGARTRAMNVASDPRVLEYLYIRGSVITSTEHGILPIFGAAYRGDLVCVKWFVRHGSSINAVDDFGRSIVSIAAESGHFHLLKWLASKGCTMFHGPQPDAIMEATTDEECLLFLSHLRLGTPYIPRAHQ
jgi:ankyrin repeat protein